MELPSQVPCLTKYSELVGLSQRFVFDPQAKQGDAGFFDRQTVLPKKVGGVVANPAVAS